MITRFNMHMQANDDPNVSVKGFADGEKKAMSRTEKPEFSL